MEATLEELMLQMCFGQKLEFKIPENLVDDLTDSRMGFSYWNEIVESTNTPLWRLVLSNKDYKLYHTSKQGEPYLNRALAMDLLQRGGIIAQLLVVLLHVTSGQPSRGTEITDVRIQNRYRKRNLYKDHGHTWIIINYNKTTNNTMMDRFIPHLVYDKLAEHLDYYLVIIRPFLEDLAAQMFGESARCLYRDYLFVDTCVKIDSEKFSRILSDATESYMGTPINIQFWRHVSIALKREFIVGHYLKQNQNEVGDQQSGHGTNAARRIYAGDTEDLPHITTDLLLEILKFNKEYHNVLGVGTGPVPIPLMLKRTSASEVRTTTQLSTRSTHTCIAFDEATTLMSGLLAQKFSDFQVMLEDRFSVLLSVAVAEAFQQGINFKASGLSSQNSTSQSFTSQSSQPLHGDHFQITSVDNIDLVQGLNPAEEEEGEKDEESYSDPVVDMLKLMIPASNGNFRSKQQEELVRHSYSGDGNLICVLGTGGGKTLS